MCVMDWGCLVSHGVKAATVLIGSTSLTSFETLLAENLMLQECFCKLRRPYIHFFSTDDQIGENLPCISDSIEDK